VNAAGAIARIQRSGLSVVTTAEAAALWNLSGKAAAESLRRLAVEGVVTRVRRGLWTVGVVEPLAVAERIAEPDLAYVSSLTALRVRGMIEQIPSDIHVATTGRARRVTTPLGRFAFRHVQGALFGGFERIRGVPIATAEKALFDILYWGAARGSSPRSLPEIELPASFNPSALESWVRRIPSTQLRTAVAQRVAILRLPSTSKKGRRRRLQKSR